MAWPGIEPGTPASNQTLLYHWAIQANIHGPSSPSYHTFIILGIILNQN